MGVESAALSRARRVKATHAREAEALFGHGVLVRDRLRGRQHEGREEGHGILELAVAVHLEVEVAARDLDAGAPHGPDDVTPP